MQIKFTADPGVTLTSKSLPNGQMIKGIQIDNPSGNWLYVVSEQQYCPPYTIGWAIPTTYDQSSITVEARLTGPASQVGSNQGEAWQIILFDEPQAPSAGTPYQFIQNYTGNNNATAFLIDVTVNGSPATIINIAGIPNKRLRIKTIDVSIFPTDGTFRFEIWDNALLFPFFLKPPALYGHFYYPDGLDITRGAAFQILCYAIQMDGSANANITYQIV